MPFPFPFKRAYPTGGEVLALKSYLTTGSMNAGSNILTVASNPGFVIGDPIIVELGGEAGAGMRGTVGVGGTWPAQSYADAAARDADTGRANGTFAWLQDTGDVYVWTAGSPGSWAPQLASQWYTKKVVPRAIVTTITGISGTTFTLATSAVVATSGANVHFDNEPYLSARGEYFALDPVDRTLIIPEGRFAMSGRWSINGHAGWTVRGVNRDTSVLFSPRGVSSAHVSYTNTLTVNVPWSGGRGGVFHDFTIEGNARNNGYGLAWKNYGAPPQVTETTITQGSGYPGGLVFGLADFSVAINVKAVDVWQKAVCATFCTDAWAYNCLCIITEPLRQYVQWMFQWADCNRGGFVGCTVDSAYMVPGFELFKCTGGVMKNCIGRNAGMSLNSVGKWVVENANLTVEANSQYDVDSWANNNFLINVNSNIQPPPDDIKHGGIILNPRVVVNGPINGSGEVICVIGINSSNPNVRVLGGYPSNPSKGGFLQCASGSKVQALGVLSTGERTTIDGIRVTGFNTLTAWGMLKVAATSTIKNCVADTIPAGGTQTNNQTNAAYIAGGGT